MVAGSSPAQRVMIRATKLKDGIFFSMDTETAAGLIASLAEQIKTKNVNSRRAEYQIEGIGYFSIAVEPSTKLYLVVQTGWGDYSDLNRTTLHWVTDDLSEAKHALRSAVSQITDDQPESMKIEVDWQTTDECTMRISEEGSNYELGYHVRVIHTDKSNWQNVDFDR